jgi:tetratricopeptide (TPR) repeat protein
MKALEDVVLFKVDAEKGEGPELKEQYRVNGYPTYILANTEVETMDTWMRYEKAHFLMNIGDALADPTTIEQKEARFASAPTAVDAGKLARYQGARGNYADAVKLYSKGEQLDPSVDYSFQIFDEMFTGFRKAEAFTVDEVRKAADAVLAHEGRDPDEIVDVAFWMKHVGSKVEDRDLWLPYLEPALTASADSDDERMQKRHAQLKIDHTLFVKKDEATAVKLKYASMPEGWKDDPKQLNSFSWWCFESMVNLEEGEALGRRGVELAPAGTERAMILDTVAEICNARGNCDDAVELIRMAIEDAPESEYYQEQLERFEAIRKASAN